jgi:hypothetical protein
MQQVGEPVPPRLRRDSWIVSRATSDELRLAQRLARRSGMTLSEFVRHRVVAADYNLEQEHGRGAPTNRGTGCVCINLPLDQRHRLRDLVPAAAPARLSSCPPPRRFLAPPGAPVADGDELVVGDERAARPQQEDRVGRTARAISEATSLHRQPDGKSR